MTHSLKVRLLSGILPIERRLLTRDLPAGLTLAAAGIPQAMGYSKIAETPVPSDSATAAILAASLVSLALPGSPE